MYQMEADLLDDGEEEEYCDPPPPIPSSQGFSLLKSCFTNFLGIRNYRDYYVN